MELPTAAAEYWNCKYKVAITDKLKGDLEAAGTKLGYIMVQVEQYGFDDDVAIIVEPRDKFYSLEDSRIDRGKEIVAINQASFGE